MSLILAYDNAILYYYKSCLGWYSGECIEFFWWTFIKGQGQHSVYSEKRNTILAKYAYFITIETCEELKSQNFTFLAIKSVICSQ